MLKFIIKYKAYHLFSFCFFKENKLTESEINYETNKSKKKFFNWKQEV